MNLQRRDYITGRENSKRRTREMGNRRIRLHNHLVWRDGGVSGGKHPVKDGMEVVNAPFPPSLPISLRECGLLTGFFLLLRLSVLSRALCVASSGSVKRYQI